MIFQILPGSLGRDVLNHQAKVRSSEPPIGNPPPRLPVISPAFPLVPVSAGVGVGKFNLDATAIKSFPIQILYGILSIIFVIYFQESILTLDVDVSQVPVSSKHLLNVPLATVMSEVAQEQSGHDAE